MDLTEGSETSAIINQTPGNYPKESLLQMKTFFHYTKHKMCQGMLFCKPAETVVKCTLTSYRVSIDYLLIFCILQFCGTAHGFLNSCYKFMHMFWNCGHILQIQTAYVTVLWFSVQKNWSTELGVFTQYGCNILVICGRDNNPVWKPLQRKILMFFSRLLLNGNLHLKPTGLVHPTSFGYVRTHNVNMELYDQYCITHWKWSPLPPPKTVNSLCGCIQHRHFL